MRRNRIFAFALALFLGLVGTLGGVLGGCSPSQEEPVRDYGENYHAEKQVVDKQLTAGMMYIVYEGETYNNVDYQKGLQTMKALGVTTIRFDLPLRGIYTSKSNVNEEVKQKAKDIVAYAQALDIRMIGAIGGQWTNGSWWENEGKYPKRNLEEGSYYLQWLDDYEYFIKKCAQDFPEITMWEIENEFNGMASDTYLDPADGSYNLQEKAEIYTDMMYRASRALHEVSVDNEVILGGLTELSGLGTTGGNATFLQYMYDCIYSGEWPSVYADDYFQIACWHPYTFSDFDPDEFVEENDKIYKVIKENEGKDKKVIFSEFGFSDATISQKTITRLMKSVFDTIRDRMPYVETFCWFRAFNDYNDKNWGGDTTLVSYGLFYDPNYEYEGSGNNKYQGTLYAPGEPKPQAYAYQACAGGSGDLTLMMSKEVIAGDANFPDDGVLAKRYGEITYAQLLTRTRALYESYKNW
jgi:hypothetical protein